MLRWQFQRQVAQFRAEAAGFQISLQRVSVGRADCCGNYGAGEAVIRITGPGKILDTDLVSFPTASTFFARLSLFAVLSRRIAHFSQNFSEPLSSMILHFLCACRVSAVAFLI